MRSTGKRFRETLWFKQGHAQSERPVAAPADAPASATTSSAIELLPVEDRYLDDGTLTQEDSVQFSLRTGQTQAVPRVAQAAAERASAEKLAPLVRELSWNRRRAAVIAASVAALCAILALCVI